MAIKNKNKKKKWQKQNFVAFVAILQSIAFETDAVKAPVVQSGLRYGPATAETRVQIPAGAHFYLLKKKIIN